jgi:hypothetical protein
MGELINCPITPRPTAITSTAAQGRRLTSLHAAVVPSPANGERAAAAEEVPWEVAIVVPASSPASVLHSPTPSDCTATIQQTTLTIRPRRYCTHRPPTQLRPPRSNSAQPLLYRPTHCGSSCPCAHHQPLLLGLVADPSLSAIRFVEHVNQKYIRSAKGTLRRRRWPATFAPMVFVHCRCHQSTPVGTTSMHCAKLAAHSRHFWRAIFRALGARFPSCQHRGP